MELSEKQQVDAMLLAVSEWLKENYPYHGLSDQKLPDGLKLQMHPSTYHAMIRNADLSYAEFGQDLMTILARRVGLPIHVTVDVERDTFRLVTVTEDVHLGGKLTI